MAGHIDISLLEHVRISQAHPNPRPGRGRVLVANAESAAFASHLVDLAQRHTADVLMVTTADPDLMAAAASHLTSRAMPNLWVGTVVTGEDRGETDRIRHLCRIPAGLRFLEVRGPVAPINLEGASCPDCEGDGCSQCHSRGYRIHWLRVQGEAGIKARPTHPDWLRQLRDRGQRLGAFEFRGWGAWLHDSHLIHSDLQDDLEDAAWQGKIEQFKWGDGSISYRLGLPHTGTPSAPWCRI